MPTEGDEKAIWQLAISLSGASSPSDVASALATDGAEAAGAAFANMAVRQGNRMWLIHGSSLQADIASRWAVVTVDDSTPLGTAIRTGAPVLLGSIKAIGARYPVLLADTVAAGLAATASFPLRTASGVLGAIGFGWTEDQDLACQDLQRLELIAALAAQALDRAQLTERERSRLAAVDEAQARLLQDAFLPAALPDVPGIEIGAAYLPTSGAPVGGDWYDAFMVDQQLCVVIGDVAGHGLHSARVMAQLRHASRAYAIEDPSPERVLSRLNRLLCRLEPDAIGTAIVAALDPTTLSLNWAAAGHPPPLWSHAGRAGYLKPADSRVPLGVDPNVSFGEIETPLDGGTSLLFYTDGLVESRGKSLVDGMEDLRQRVAILGDASPDAVCDALVAWRSRTVVREDDLCILAVRMGTPT